MQYIMRFKVLPHKSEELRDFLIKNDKLLHEGQPQGWHYLGTWATVHGFGQYDCEMRFELDDYAALGSGFGSQALQDAMVEMWDFITPNVGESVLMKSMDDILIMKGA